MTNTDHNETRRIFQVSCIAEHRPITLRHLCLIFQEAVATIRVNSKALQNLMPSGAWSLCMLRICINWHLIQVQHGCSRYLPTPISTPIVMSLILTRSEFPATGMNRFNHPTNLFAVWV